MLCLPNLFVSQIFWPLFSFPAFWAGQIPCKETDILADSTSPDAQVDLPAEDQGIRAVFWSDPCFSSKWITCVPWIPRVKSEGGPELDIGDHRAVPAVPLPTGFSVVAAVGTRQVCRLYLYLLCAVIQ